MSRRAERASRTAVRDFWRVVAAGGRPDKEDLQRAGFPEVTWRGIHCLADRILTTRGSGNRREARRLASEAVEALLTDLGPSWAPPEPPDPDLDSMTPDQLATYVTTGQVPSAGQDDDPFGIKEIPR
jgi:hypothetical protein